MNVSQITQARTPDTNTPEPESAIDQAKVLVNTMAGYERVRGRVELVEQLKRFQKSEGQPITGAADTSTIEKLQRAVADRTINTDLNGDLSQVIRRTKQAATAELTHLKESAVAGFGHLKSVVAKEVDTVGRSHMNSSALATSHHATEQAAQTAFEFQSSRLLDVNRWSDLSGMENASFALHNSAGLPTIATTASEGDFVRIKLPGVPGSDWVRIEKVTISAESVSIRVRPSVDPSAPATTPPPIAHFFTDTATNTFSIECHGTTVDVRVDGHDETANTGASSGGLERAVRNRAIAEGAWGAQVRVPGTAVQINGGQQHQWNCFTENLSKVQ